MRKSERFVMLAKFWVGEVIGNPRVCFEALDCLSNMPEELIPDLKSLRFFVDGCLLHFLAGDSNFVLEHTKAAKWIDAWQTKWKAEKQDH